jgi:hypothetical protein
MEKSHYSINAKGELVSNNIIIIGFWHDKKAKRIFPYLDY